MCLTNVNIFDIMKELGNTTKTFITTKTFLCSKKYYAN